MGQGNTLENALLEQLLVAIEVEGPVSRERAFEFLESTMWLFNNREELPDATAEELEAAEAYAERFTEALTQKWGN